MQSSSIPQQFVKFVKREVWSQKDFQRFYAFHQGCGSAINIMTLQFRFSKRPAAKKTHFPLNTSASTLYFFAFNISTSFQHIIVCNNRAIHTLYIFSILRIVWKFFHMRRALLSPIMMLPLNLCFLAQLLNCGGAPPYFVDMSVDEPTVVRAPPPDRFPGVGSSKYLPQVSISKRGSCQIYFPG